MQTHESSGHRGWLAVVFVCIWLAAGTAAAQETETSGGSSDPATEAPSGDGPAPEDGGEDGGGESPSRDGAAKTEEGDGNDGNEDGEAGGKKGEYPPEVYDPAWARYREAFVTLAAGDRRKALEQLRALKEKYEGHAAALFAGPIIEQLESTIAEKDKAAEETRTQTEGGDEPADESLPPSKTDRLGLERPTGLARAELVSYQTLHGIALGGELCAVAQCADARALIGTMVLGGGAGLGLSLYATRDGITSGRASAVNAGVQWGFWNAAALNTITDNWGNRPPSGSILPLMAGQLAGLGGGYLAASQLRPHAGDVALANSTGLWAGAFTGLFTLTIGATASPRGLMTALLLTSDLGVAAGGYLASQNPMARGRVYVINTGGLLGGLLGAGTAVLFGGNLVGAQVAGGLTMVGAGSGLAIATALTSDWPLDEGDQRQAATTSFAIRPARSGEGAVLSVGGEF